MRKKLKKQKLKHKKLVNHAYGFMKFLKSAESLYPHLHQKAIYELSIVNQITSEKGISKQEAVELYNLDTHCIDTLHQMYNLSF